MKKFIQIIAYGFLIYVWLFWFGHLLHAQSQTTVTGVVFDSGGNPATSGFVEFDLQPVNSGVQFTIPGIGVIAPQNTVCGIDGSGNVKNLANLANPCLVWGNSVVSPANTTYTVQFAPGGVVTNVVSQECINGASYSLAAPVFCPRLSLNPQSAFVITTPIQQNLIPGADAVFSLGSLTNRYANLFSANGTFTNLTLLNTLVAPTLSISGNATVGGTFGVTGLTTLNSGTLNGTFAGNPIFTGNVSAAKFLGGDGSAAAPSYSFTNSTNAGMGQAGGIPFLSSGGVIRAIIAIPEVRLNAGTPLAWSSSAVSPFGAVADTGLSRDSAGVIDVGNGTQGDKSGSINLTSATFSSGALSLRGFTGNPVSVAGGSAASIDFIVNNAANSKTLLTVPDTGGIQIGGSTSGNVAIVVPAVASGTQTLQATTGTVADFNVAQTWSGNQTNMALVTPTISGTVLNYNGAATVGNGLASITATADPLAQTANIASTPLLTVGPGGGGLYNVEVYTIVTSVGTTSTLPAVNIIYTDRDNNTVQTVPFTVTSNGNTLTTVAINSFPINVKASTTISYSTSGYASTGAPMQYSVHIKVLPLL